MYSKQYLTFGEYLEDKCSGNGSFLSITEQTPLTDTHIHHYLTAKPQLFSYTITVKKEQKPLKNVPNNQLSTYRLLGFSRSSLCKCVCNTSHSPA